MHTPKVTLRPAQWQQAIEESWLLCADETLRHKVQTAIDAQDYLYFSPSRQGSKQQHRQLALVLSDITHHDCWCFYQEANQEPALEPCHFIPQPARHQALSLWSELIFNLEQEAFVSGTATGHQVWQTTTQEHNYSPSVLSTAPLCMTTETLQHFIN